jgi:hypothetical protein
MGVLLGVDAQSMRRAVVAYAGVRARRAERSAGDWSIVD